MTYQQYLKLTAQTIKGYDSNLIGDCDIFSNTFYTIVMASYKWKKGKGLPFYRFLRMNGIYKIRKMCNSSKKKRPSFKSLPDDFIARNKGPLEEIIIREITEIINRSNITDRQKDLIINKYLLGFPTKELAKKHKISPTTVYNELERGIKRLKLNKDLQDIWFIQ
jgi:DNA-directed RNA polymerase specialized sigma24 family protein